MLPPSAIEAAFIFSFAAHLVTVLVWNQFPIITHKRDGTPKSAEDYAAEARFGYRLYFALVPHILVVLTVVHEV